MAKTKDMTNEEKRLRKLCASAIEEAIYNNFDGLHLSKDAIKQVVDEFGKERVEYVLANTISYKHWDSRFSHLNREWAADIVPIEHFDESFIVESHPAVLDGFTTLARNYDEVAKENVIMALLVAPGKEPKQVCFEHTLKNLQDFVGGYIEAIYPFDDSVAIVCNEEGKLDGLPLNRTISSDYSKDIIAGTFLVVGTGEEDFCSLTTEQIDRYKEMFKEPEIFKDGFYPEPFAAVDMDDLEL